VKPLAPSEFARKDKEAQQQASGHDAFMIRHVMNRSDWLLLLSLAIIWGSG